MWLTILLAIIVVLFSILGLSIGLILTGKPKLTKGCGRLPEDKKCKPGNCSICSKKKKG